MTYDGSSRKDVRKAEKAAAQALVRRRTFIRRIMQEHDGREWMHELLTRCHVFHTPFVQGSIDGTAFNCGEQNLGLQIFADVLTAAPAEYQIMMNEAMQKEIVNERRNDNDRVSTEPAGAAEDSGRDDSGLDNQSVDDFGQEPGPEIH